MDLKQELQQRYKGALERIEREKKLSAHDQVSALEELVKAAADKGESHLEVHCHSEEAKLSVKEWAKDHGLRAATMAGQDSHYTWRIYGWA